jgi:hypothetical protein
MAGKKQAETHWISGRYLKVPECDLARPLTWLSGAGVMSAVLLLEGP